MPIITITIQIDGDKVQIRPAQTTEPAAEVAVTADRLQFCREQARKIAALFPRRTAEREDLEQELCFHGWIASKSLRGALRAEGQRLIVAAMLTRATALTTRRQHNGDARQPTAFKKRG